METLKAMVYTTKHIHKGNITDELIGYFRSVGKRDNEIHGNKYKWELFHLGEYMDKGRMVVCFRDDTPVGVMLYRLYDSIFDGRTKILMQDLLWAEKGSRAAKHLMDEFIDFGKANADHLITMVTPFSNVSPRSLERLGFKYMETQYRLEV
jgi:hypothetical protein